MLLILLTAIITQIFIPGIRGTVLFPWLRKKTKVQSQIIETEEQIATQAQSETLSELKKKIRTKTKETPKTVKKRKTVIKTK